MGKHNARPRRGRLIPVLGTSCGLLAAAAFTGGVRPAIALPDSGDATVAVARGAAESASDDAGLFMGGPLQMPEIGVVAPGFDERYAALLSASHTRPAPRPAPRWPAPAPAEQTPTPTSPPPVARHSSGEVSPPPPPPPPVDNPPNENPPAENPPAEEPPVKRPPAEKPPAEKPPAEKPPTDEPVEEPLEDVELALGEAFDVLDASGQLVYTVVVDAVVPDVGCTADGSLPAENGSLVGLQLRVTTGPAPAEGAPSPSISSSDFGVLSPDGTPGAEPGTAAAAACLDESEVFPSSPLAPERETAGTIVLDVAELTGAVTFRPAAPSVSLVWQF